MKTIIRITIKKDFKLLEQNRFLPNYIKVIGLKWKCDPVWEGWNNWPTNRGHDRTRKHVGPSLSWRVCYVTVPCSVFTLSVGVTDNTARLFTWFLTLLEKTLTGTALRFPERVSGKIRLDLKGKCQTYNIKITFNRKQTTLFYCYLSWFRSLWIPRSLLFLLFFMIILYTVLRLSPILET